ncbi:MAG: hypothetical protein LKF79_01600 [Solobacterium sp.]|jgi:hypothetical protein|nr:hypothetical protein [Solobacterium sp.]MCH4265322.1 hypothetical protein [Solobacterium sp.]
MIHIHLYLVSSQQTVEVSCSSQDTFEHLLLNVQNMLESLSQVETLDHETCIYEQESMQRCSMNIPLASLNVCDGMFFMVL